MDAQAAADLARLFAVVDDPRADNAQHLLVDVLTITFLAVLCGCDDYPDIVEYARDKEALLRQMLRLRAGIPSCSTFRRVLARIAPAQLEQVLRAWMGLLAGTLAGKQVALDGKTLRRSFAHAWKKMGLHVVTAWCVQDQLVLAQQAVSGKSNEIPVVPQLLKLLDLTGVVVTADAMHCQKQTIQQIRSGGGDYVLAVKGNQPELHQQVKGLLDEAALEGFVGIGHVKEASFQRAHGRETLRRVYVSAQLAGDVRERADWADLACLVLVESQNGEHRERRYYISSLPQSQAPRIIAAIRNHWSIENGQHWCLDMAFDEDWNRVRSDHGPENLAILRRLALSVLKQDKTVKAGIATKRHKAARNDSYLFHLLKQCLATK
jgi:predicted transposase YbfD/YdcC